MLVSVGARKQDGDVVGQSLNLSYVVVDVIEIGEFVGGEVSEIVQDVIQVPGNLLQALFGLLQVVRLMRKSGGKSAVNEAQRVQLWRISTGCGRTFNQTRIFGGFT